MGLVLYLLGSMRISQSAQSFIKIIISRAKISNHYRFSIPAQRVLQQPSQLAIPVRNMSRFIIYKCRDHVSQSCQRLVYINSFFETVSLGLGFRLSFRTGQIHQVQFPYSDFGFSVHDFTYFDCH